MAIETVSGKWTAEKLLKAYPSSIEVLSAYGINYSGGCNCNYNESLEDAAKRKGLTEKQLADVVSELNSLVKKEYSDESSSLVNITGKAAEKIKELLAKQKLESSGLRLMVVPGGCAGFSYGMEFAEKPVQGEQELESKGIKVFVNNESKNYLKGITIDFVESLQGAGFKIINPNVSSSCACGESFS